MARPTHRWILALTATLALGSACNKELQGQADVLMEALDAGDYAKFKAIASDKLLADMSESRFSDFVDTYDELGEMKDKTRNSVGINNDQKNVTYRLDFAGGEVDLAVVSNSDKLDGFEVSGAGWRAAQIARHRGALENMLTTMRGKDRAAIRALVHPTIADATLDQTVAGIENLGEPKAIEVHDDTIPEFRVVFADKTFIGSVRLGGSSIVGYAFRPADAAPPS